jgi:hypothetical protein
MNTMMTISAVRVEQAEVTLPSENFEVGYEGDFERVLERSRQNRESLTNELERHRQELRDARKELEDGLRSRREDLKAELKKASQMYQEYQKELREVAKEEEAQEAESFGANRVDKRTAMASLVVAGSLLPTPFKKQLGVNLMASGKSENGVNGYLLSGGGRPTAFLKNTLEKLGSLGQSWNLDKEALPELQELFLESGVPPEEAMNLITSLASKELTLDNVLMTVGKADSLAAQGENGEQFLTATPGGLNNLGQFLASLGLSSEVVKAVTSMTPGQSFTSFDLKDILTQNGSEEILAPLLVEGDLNSLVEALKLMGADQNTLGQLSTLLTTSQGQTSLNDLLGLLAFSEQPGPMNSDPKKVASQIQNLLSKTDSNTELVKAPLFNEIILKMTLLGDRQISDDFADLSPALQSLRGGLSVWREGQSGNFEQGGGGQQQGREREERLMAQSGLHSQTLGRGLEQPLFEASLSQETAGYAGETLARQISQKLIYSARKGIHRLKMNLDPESLGHLDVELKVKGDKLIAYIKAESLEAYEALEKEMANLKDSLSQAGLELDMTLSYDGQSGQAMARSGYGQAQAGNHQTNGNSLDPNEDELNAQASDNRLLDRLV